MAMGKKLKQISISANAGVLCITFTPDSGPQDHYLLSAKVADEFIDKLAIAYESLMQPKAPGDGVSVSDYAAVQIKPPTEH